jgi:hypothetical protein
MTRRALVLLTLTVCALLVPAVALAAIKHGYYIEVKSQTYIQTNSAGTSIKSFNFPCMVDGTQQGGNNISKGIKISSTGSFSYKGKSTLQSSSNSVISVAIAGKYTGGKLKGTIKYKTDGVACADRSFSAKYYGTKVEG